MDRRLMLAAVSVLAAMATLAAAGCGNKAPEQENKPPTADSRGRMPTATPGGAGGASSKPVAPTTE